MLMYDTCDQRSCAEDKQHLTETGSWQLVIKCDVIVTAGNIHLDMSMHSDAAAIV